jgi:hypothetical protein
MSAKDDFDDKRKKDGRDRGVVLRHDAKEAKLKDRRVWLSEDEELEFDRAIAPLGPHVLGLAAALAHHRSRSPKGRTAASKPNDATPPPGPDAEPKPADASQVTKVEPATPPIAAATPELPPRVQH